MSEGIENDYQGFEDHASQFFMNLKKLKDSGFYCDVCLQADSSSLFCHGIVLAASSNVLHSLISSNKNSFEKVMIVKLPESFNANAMELVVEFFYSRKLHIDQNIVADVLIIAEFLQLSSVVTECNKFISNISKRNKTLNPGSSIMSVHCLGIPNKFKCNDCFMVFFTKKNFNKHVREKHQLKKFSCSHCSKTFDRKSDAELHKRRKHMLNKPFACKLCDKTFSLRRELQVHERIHKCGYAYKCDLCTNTFKTHQGYMHHSRHAHVKQRHHCQREGCGLSFSSKNKLDQHYLSCGQKLASQFECGECGRLFGRQHLLQRHHRTVHLKLKPFKCDVCARRFAREEQLSQHIPSHTGNKEYECVECGKRFRQRASLSVHKRKHSDSNKVVCDQCGYHCHSVNELRRHQGTHSSDRRHICEVCAKSFKTVQTLKRHLKLHETRADVEKISHPIAQASTTSIIPASRLLKSPPDSSPVSETRILLKEDSVKIAYPPVRLVDDITTVETFIEAAK